MMCRSYESSMSLSVGLVSVVRSCSIGTPGNCEATAAPCSRGTPLPRFTR